MNLRPNHRLTALVEAAFGELDMEALGPITGSERTRLGQHARLAEAFRAGVYNAPAESIALAKGLAPQSKPRTSLVARLVRSTLGAAAGARFDSAERFVAAFESEGHNIRISYQREAFAWRVMGEIDSGSWIALLGDESTPVSDNGRFEFMIADLAQAEIKLVSESTVIVVPAFGPPESGGTR